jgi:cell filamentation protein
MQKFNDEYVAVFTPCNHMDENQLLDALATAHVEFVPIHLFREGNGRLSRLLANVMALQAGQPLLDFTYLDEHKAGYFAAMQAGNSGDSIPVHTNRQLVHLKWQQLKIRCI